MTSCAHCVTGITHKGTPIGSIKQIGGHDTYVSLPKKDYSKDKAVLLLPDIFGIQFINCKLLADDFARSGLAVYAPDYLNGDPAPEPNPKVAATAHPSFLRVPEDQEKLLRLSKAPILINGAEVDQQYPIESQLKGDEILGSGKYEPGYKRIFWPGTTHGFAVRGDLNNPEVKMAKEGAFKATMEFFYEHLLGKALSSKL
ncbi:hypothetical protein Clacol_005417 [Clathrus columnatus]|uniref:Dienelactone hydrolase domain-containing protein n=1 Tax=Clathrus columnatus TaxID=1419009 RepID=A0AAV5AGW7_9AGAM|nr:hypothetical protein Clacol_005417 [Clathrus columnatus]